jgi:hypothetical protein
MMRCLSRCDAGPSGEFREAALDEVEPGAVAEDAEVLCISARMPLTHRKLLQSKAIAIENDLRGTLRNFGLKVGMVGTVKFEARIKELITNLPDLAELVEPAYFPAGDSRAVRHSA